MNVAKNEMKPTVSVVMITYNHDKFIAEAIEGVLMQQANFPVELIIADDCSPDATSQVVQHYIDSHPNGGWISYHRHPSNKGMMSNLIWAFEQAKGDFIAVCEGDDYWIHPLKLQKQVDFLEEHPTYAFVHTDYDYLYNKTGKVTPNYYLSIGLKNSSGHVFEFTFLTTFIRTLTTCFRKEFLLECSHLLDISEKNKWIGADLQIYLYLTYKYPIGYMDESFGVYRRLEESASTSHSASKRIKFQRSHLEIRYYFLERFKINHLDSFFVPLLRDFIFLCYYDRDIDSFKYGYNQLKNLHKSNRLIDKMYNMTITNFSWYIIVFFIKTFISVKIRLKAILLTLQNKLRRT